MVDNKNFIFLYVILFLVILFFSFLYVIFILDIKFPVSDLLFKEKDLEVVSKIVYVEGNDVYFAFKGGNKNELEYNTAIKSGMIIETGKNSYAGFYIKDQGYYYLFPETSIYIKKLEKYITEKSVKESLINLEKGVFYLDVNFYSINSYLSLETQDCVCELNEAKLLLDKTKDFETEIFCFGGKINYRAYSEKFKFFEQKKNLSLTNSIERLINSSNVLNKNRHVVVDVTDQNRLDSILNRLYESENTNLLSKEYITSLLKIADKETGSGIMLNYEIPDFDMIKFNVGDKGYMGIVTPANNRIEFNDRTLDNNDRYLYCLDTGGYTVVQDLEFTKIMNNFNINENGFTGLVIEDVYGITDAYLDNMRMNISTTLYDAEDGNGQKRKSLLVSLTGNGFDSQGNENTISLNSDLPVKKFYLLSVSNITSDNILQTGKSELIGGKRYGVYEVAINNKNNLQLTINGKFHEDENMFLIFFDDIYIKKN